MAGGVFEYLYTSDAEDLICPRQLNYLRQAAQRLMSLGHRDAADEVEKLADEVSVFLLKAQAKMEPLRDLLHAAEWEKSGTWEPEKVAAVASQYAKVNVQEPSFRFLVRLRILWHLTPEDERQEKYPEARNLLLQYWLSIWDASGQDRDSRNRARMALVALETLDFLVDTKRVDPTEHLTYVIGLLSSPSISDEKLESYLRYCEEETSCA